jgi:hypothetical protein
MIDLFWDIRQSADIAAAQRAVARSEGNVERVRTDLQFLEERVDRLTMIAAAMWTLLQKQTGLSDEHLRDRVQEIDLTDGRLDGKVRRDVSACPSCKRPIAPRHTRCIYCGQPTRNTQPFDAVL